MSQIVALLIVVLGFTLLVAWVYWPSNRERLESYGSEIIDSEIQEKE